METLGRRAAVIRLINTKSINRFYLAETSGWKTPGQVNEEGGHLVRLTRGGREIIGKSERGFNHRRIVKVTCSIYFRNERLVGFFVQFKKCIVGKTTENEMKYFLQEKLMSPIFVLILVCKFVFEDTR